MSVMPSMNSLEEVAKDLSTSICKAEECFKCISVDEYEAEMFYKGLSDAKNFVSTLNWLVKRHDM